MRPWLGPFETLIPRRSRAIRPCLEPIERRELLSGAAHAGASAGTVAAAISRYRIFSGTVPEGHGKTLSIKGPILLGQTDARGQVIGAIYNANGSRDGVVGLAFAGEISLQITTPSGKTLHVAGTGELKGVSGGIPGYDALTGRGNLVIVKGPTKFGTWTTTKAISSP